MVSMSRNLFAMKISQSVLLAFITFASINAVMAQKLVLDGYDFQDGGYSLVMIPSVDDPQRYEDFLTTPDTFPAVYFDAIETLEALKKTIIAGSRLADDPWECYNIWTILVCKAGSFVERFEINDCGQIQTTEGKFQFDGHINFEGYKLAHSQRQSFQTPRLARNTMDSLLGIPGIIGIDSPDWIQFDGTMHFLPIVSSLSIEEIKSAWRRRLLLNCPDEPFDLSVKEFQGQTGQNEPTPTVTFALEVTCNETLVQKFRSVEEQEVEWVPFRLELTSFWIRNSVQANSDHL